MAIITAQRDFSSGELNVDARRRDDQPLMRTSARQLRNWRVLNSGAVINRAGRRALFGDAARVDQILVAPGTLFYLKFTTATLEIYDASFNQVGYNTAAYGWTDATVRQIVIAIVPTATGQRDIVMTFPGQQPKVASWKGGTNWTFNNFNFGTNTDGSLQLPFYRLSTSGVTIQPSATVGAIAIIASAPVFFPGMVGTVIRWINRQILITGYTDSQHVTGTVLQQLYGSLNVTASAGFTGSFGIGDIIADTQGNSAEVFGITTSGGSITALQVNLMQARIFTPSQGVYGPGGSFTLTGQTSILPGASVQWDDAVFSSYRGWPQSCFFDQKRLGFCDIPALPSGIAWSRIGLFTDFYVSATTPSDPMLELAPERAHVYHVAAKSDELVLTDRGIWHIPISETNPLKPGSVAFKKVSVDAASSVPPTQTNEGIVFIGAGLNRVIAVVPTGNYSQVWTTRETSLFHSHLFNQPFAIASTTGDDATGERYVYVLNIDGTIVVGKYDAGKQWVGWLPWDSKGTPQWVSVLGASTLVTTRYGTKLITEALDPTIYLDGAINVNNPPTPISPAAGKGPLWWLPNGSVDLMDGVMPKGTYQIDANGFIIPNIPGEDLSSATLMAGQSWTATLEPFVDNVDAGQDQHQRIRRRRIMRVVATVEGSTGFKFSKLYSGQEGPLLPPLGAEIGSHRIPAWRLGDSRASAPPLREESYAWRPTGRSFDPRIALVKDVPGPLTVLEVAMQVTT